MSKSYISCYNNETKELEHFEVPYSIFVYIRQLEDEVRKFLHKYGYDDINNFMSVFSNATVDDFYKILSSVEIIRDSLSSDKVDLGIDYKKKYEELVELLEPHKIDDNMSPATTLKMILKYHK
jgi:hypothetical protein